MRRRIAMAGMVGALLCAGCASQRPLYYWGNYQPLIYKMYVEPGEAPPERQVEIMEADIEQARAQDLALPPGFQAHLGFLYYQLGKYDMAKQSFETEKVNFPESAVLMNRFIQRLEGGDA